MDRTEEQIKSELRGEWGYILFKDQTGYSSFLRIGREETTEQVNEYNRSRPNGKIVRVYYGVGDEGLDLLGAELERQKELIRAGKQTELDLASLDAKVLMGGK
ncbi:MAG: hypothetical protein AABX04_02395 [Nanoarchaeota archaeon]